MRSGLIQRGRVLINHTAPAVGAGVVCLRRNIKRHPQGTPLYSIIPYCIERSEEGKKILSALRDWWKTGVNDVGAPRPGTISPIPEGIPLLEAEKIVREREPGDESMQKSVLEQIASVL